MTSFGITRELAISYEQTVSKLPDALKSEGFGVLTEIDMQNTLKQKLNVDFRKYKIFGACNPPLAHQALSLDLQVGLAMPCNVVVYEASNGHAVVSAVDPTKTVSAIGNPALADFAITVRDKLTRALDKL